MFHGHGYGPRKGFPITWFLEMNQRRSLRARKTPLPITPVLFPVNIAKMSLVKVLTILDGAVVNLVEYDTVPETLAAV